MLPSCASAPPRALRRRAASTETKSREGRGRFLKEQQGTRALPHGSPVCAHSALLDVLGGGRGQTSPLALPYGGTEGSWLVRDAGAVAFLGGRAVVLR